MSDEQAPPLAELLRVGKRFAGLTALDDVSLSLAPGRVHGLLGENGAGKTTLMNILYGLVRPDAGEIRAGGRAAVVRSPRDAIARGVGMVHQHFMLAGAMTVLDNVLLGDRRLGQWIDRRAQARRLESLSRRVGLPIDPSARAGDLSVGQQQRVEILKALYRDVRVLILDEPTAVLTPAEADQLFAAVARLRAQGRAVVFISHKLGEVKRVCDDLTVLRRGKKVWEGPADGATAEELSRHMVGRDVARVSLARAGEAEGGGARVEHRTSNIQHPTSKEGKAIQGKGEAAGAPALVLDHVSAAGLRDVCLHVNGGEILGIAGVDGNGQQELAEIVVGLRRPAAGRVLLAGRDVTPLPAGPRQALGVAHVPNDRKREGLVGPMSVAQNLVLKSHARRPFSSFGVMRWSRARRAARGLLARFDIRARSIDAPASSLSGGNQQKVILARELALGPSRGVPGNNAPGPDAPGPALIVATNPVRGLDVGATNFVYEQLLARRAAGSAVLLVSSELDELLALCDRIAVLYNGRLTPSRFPLDGAEALGRMMTGT